MNRFVCVFLLCLLALFSSITANANEPSPEREKAYTLKSVPTAGVNTITKFELDSVTNKLTPKYYEVVLAKNTYGDAVGNIEYDFKINGSDIRYYVEKIISGNEVISFYGQNVNQDSKNYENYDGRDEKAFERGYSYSMSRGAAIHLNHGSLGDVSGKFLNNVTSAFASLTLTNKYPEESDPDYRPDYISFDGDADASAYGGAVQVNGKVKSINGDFVSNRVLARSELFYEYDVDNPAESYYRESVRAQASGGAINVDVQGQVDSINANFINNSAKATVDTPIGTDELTGYTGKSAIAMGGAISNKGAIGDIKGDFLGNNVSALANTGDALAKGGAIYNTRTIGNINGNFIGNYAYSSKNNHYDYSHSNIYESRGGAIYNGLDHGNGFNGKIGDIKGDFLGNYAYSDSTYDSYNAFVQGGAVFNDQNCEVGNITGDFISNYVMSKTNAIGGGAIYNSGTIGEISGSFIGNYVKTDGDNAKGGAINNDYSGIIGNFNGDFIGNYVKIDGGNASGGAINNDYSGTIGNLNGDFIGNYVTSNGRGSNAIGGAILNSDTIGEISGSFIGNYAKSDGGYANGGAIYTAENVTFSADNKAIEFTGNYTEDQRGKIQNAIYVGSNSKNTTIILKAKNNGSINFNDQIDGDSAADAYNLKLTGDSTGKIALNNDIINANVILDDVNLRLGKDSVLDQSKSLTLNSGSLDLQNNKASSIAVPKVVVNGNISTKIDADLSATGKIDNFKETDVSGTGKFSIDSINVVKDMDANVSSVVYDFLKKESSVSFDLNVPESTIITSLYTYYLGTNDDKQIIFEKANDLGGFAAAVANSSENVDYFITVENEIVKGYSILSGNSQQSKNLSIHGNGNALDGNGRDGVIVVAHKTLNIQDVGNFNEEKPEESKGWSGFKNSAIRNNGNLNIKNSVFVNNSSDKGGAIYTTGDVTIAAENGITYFGGNKMVIVEGAGTADEKTTEISNAIYVDSAVAKFTLDAKDNGVILLDDQIDGKKGFALKLTGNETGQINLNNNVLNADLTLEKTNLNLGKDNLLNNVQSLTLSSGTLSMVNDSAGMMNVSTFNLAGNTNFAADVDLENKSMDRITADNYNISPDAKLNVNYLNILNDAKDYKTDILFAESDFAANVNYTGISPVAYSPLYKYAVSYDPTNGMFSFTGGPSSSSGSYNPSVLAPSVATQAGAYSTQLQTFNYAFQHADSFMNIPYLERMAIKNSGKYAFSPTADATDVGTFSPLLTKQESAGFWFKPYSSFESIPLNNGPKVSNINYGTLVGYDSDLKSVKNGFERVITGYIGYNGASQRYSGVDAYQNGGVLGTTITLYKNNFFNATTLSVGASAGNTNNMYGSENYTMLLGGIANKIGYNFEFLDGKLIFQPSFLLSYTFVNTFDYNNAAGLRIKSDPLNAIQIAPGMKIIGNLESGWQPYLGVNMIWNLLDETKVTANDVRLPEMSIDPYIQYGVGLQKRFGNRVTGYGQAMIQNGGRNGIALSVGLRWAIGKK